MATTESNSFEIERRVILFKPTTTLPDESVLGYDGDPNDVINGNTAGETLIYNCPINTRYSESDGSEWTKRALQNTWVKLGSTTLISLDDTPSSYDTGKYLRSTISGTEWVVVSGTGTSDVQNFLDLTDTPTTYSGYAGQYLRVALDESGFEYTTTSGSGNATTILNDWTLYGGSVYYANFEHNLSTEQVAVFVVDTATNKRVGVEDIEIINVNTIRVYVTDNTLSLKINVITGGFGTTNTLHHHDERYYSEAEVDVLVASASGTTNHSELDNLDYASSGHTGFQPSGDYVTEVEFTTYSGTLQTQIDDKSDIGHLHDDVYYTEAEVDTISGTLIPASTFTADGEIIVATSSGTYQAESGATARESLGAAASGANTDITSLGAHGLTGTLSLSEQVILIDAALASDGTWTGPTQSVTAGEELTIGETAYLKSDGKYWLADANTEATADTKLVMATATIAADASGIVLLPSALSFIRVDATTEWTVTGAGDVMFLSTTKGELTNNVSGYTTLDIVRICGYMETVTVLNFNVSKDFYEVT